MALEKDFFPIVTPKICIRLTTVDSVEDEDQLRLLVSMKCLNLAEFNEASTTCGTLLLQIMNVFLEETNKRTS